MESTKLNHICHTRRAVHADIQLHHTMIHYICKKTSSLSESCYFSCPLSYLTLLYFDADSLHQSIQALGYHALSLCW